jgi:hypothetical protein
MTGARSCVASALLGRRYRRAYLMPVGWIHRGVIWVGILAETNCGVFSSLIFFLHLDCGLFQ